MKVEKLSLVALATPPNRRAVVVGVPIFLAGAVCGRQALACGAGGLGAGGLGSTQVAAVGGFVVADVPAAALALGTGVAVVAGFATGVSEVGILGIAVIGFSLSLGVALAGTVMETQQEANSVPQLSIN